METPVIVEVPSGPTLEAHLDLLDSAAAGLVLCHPHPLYGGDMDNPVIIRAAEVAQALVPRDFIERPLIAHHRLA